MAVSTVASAFEELLCSSRAIVYASDEEGAAYESGCDYDTCKVCFAATKDVLFDCGHLLCKACADKIIFGAASSCPFCRAHVEMYRPAKIAGKALRTTYKGRTWNAAGCASTETRKLLVNMRIGSFLVRESASLDNTYSLDVLVKEGRVCSFRIVHKAAGWRFALDPLNGMPEAEWASTLDNCLAQFEHPLGYRLLYPGGKRSSQ